ncbi:MAG: hypothetical protein FJX47_03805 [Alphaproteobacteria bacterium]|nr:hypothetical protein [Alphaproteobacteria bacterium]
MHGYGYEAMALFPAFLLGIPFAIGNGILAAKLGRSVFWWVVLTLLPLINFVFLIYAFYVFLFHVVDALKASRPPGPASPGT